MIFSIIGQASILSACHFNQTEKNFQKKTKNGKQNQDVILALKTITTQADTEMKKDLNGIWIF